MTRPVGASTTSMPPSPWNHSRAMAVITFSITQRGLSVKKLGLLWGCMSNYAYTIVISDLTI
jgi:hypothetical protein